MRFSRSTHLLFFSLETLTSIMRTGLPILVELIDLTNSISNDLTQMVKFLTQISDCDSHSPALLDFFLSPDASICSAIGFPPLGNSDQVVVSVSIDFPQNSQQDALFHCLAYGYSLADWNGLCDHFRDVPWEDIFELGGSSAASELCDRIQVGIDVHEENIRSNLTHLHGFHLPVQLP